MRPETSSEMNQAWSDFLWDPSSRCIICLVDEAGVKIWKTHPRFERVFICGDCAKGKFPLAAPAEPVDMPVPYTVVRNVHVTQEMIDEVAAVSETYAEECRRRLLDHGQGAE